VCAIDRLGVHTGIRCWLASRWVQIAFYVPYRWLVWIFDWVEIGVRNAAWKKRWHGFLMSWYIIYVVFTDCVLETLGDIEQDRRESTSTCIRTHSQINESRRSDKRWCRTTKKHIKEKEWQQCLKASTWLVNITTRWKSIDVGKNLICCSRRGKYQQDTTTITELLLPLVLLLLSLLSNTKLLLSHYYDYYWSSQFRPAPPADQASHTGINLVSFAVCQSIMPAPHGQSAWKILTLLLFLVTNG
jgi:hypothetical protein